MQRRYETTERASPIATVTFTQLHPRRPLPLLASPSLSPGTQRSLGMREARGKRSTQSSFKDSFRNGNFLIPERRSVGWMHITSQSINTRVFSNGGFYSQCHGRIPWFWLINHLADCILEEIPVYDTSIRVFCFLNLAFEPFVNPEDEYKALSLNRQVLAVEGILRFESCDCKSPLW